MVAERMYNIYYLMRRRGKPADRVKAAVKFMVSMYDPESATKLIIEEAGGLSPELCSNHYLAYSEVVKAVRDRQQLERIITSTPKSFLESPYVNDTLESILTISGQKIPKDSELKKVIEIIEQGYELYKDRNYTAAIEKLDDVIRKYKRANNIRLISEAARAMFNKGVSLGALNRSEEAIKVYDELIALYKDRSEPQITESVAGAMFNKGVRLGALNRSEEEIKVYDELIALHKDRSEPQLAEQVARAMFNKGVCLGALNRSEEEIKVYDELIALYKDRSEPQLTEQAARAMVNKGVSLGALNRSEEEIKVYDELIALYKDRSEPQLAEQAARAMFNKGVSLGALNRSEEEIKVYDELIALYKDHSEPQLAEQVAGAMFNKGVRLGALNRSEEEIKVYDELIALYKDHSEPQLAEQVARAMFNKGVSLGALNRSEEEIKVYDELIALYKDRSEPQLAEQVARAMFNKGVCLGALKRYEEAVQIAEEAVERFPERPSLLNALAWAFYEYGDVSILDTAELLVRKAATLSPESLSIQHTLSCILIALGKKNEALESAKKYIGDAAFVQQTMEDAIQLFVEFAAAGYAEQALDILTNSPSVKHVEPLVVGLKLYLGEKIKVAVEIREVANDVVKRIEELRKKRIQNR